MVIKMFNKLGGRECDPLSEVICIVESMGDA